MIEDYDMPVPDFIYLFDEPTTSWLVMLVVGLLIGLAFCGPRKTKR